MRAHRLTRVALSRQSLAEKIAEEQVTLRRWEALDEELQEVEVDKARRPSPDACPAFGPRARPRRSSQASFLAGKQKERDHALDKAQHAEAALEALKDRYRELRRAEDHALSAVDDAAAAGDEARRALASESSALGRKKAALAEHLRAAETDRAAIFAETQRVEAEMRAEREAMAEAQRATERYRALLQKVM